MLSFYPYPPPFFFLFLNHLSSLFLAEKLLKYDKIMDRKHPHHRLESPSRSLSAAFHVLGIAIFVYDFRYLVVHPTFCDNEYGWNFQFLTVLAIALSLVAFSCGLIADLTNSHHFFVIKITLCVCTAPLEILVSILYYGLEFLYPNSILPGELQSSNLVDFAFHGAPAILLFIDVMFLSPQWEITTSRAFGLFLMLVVMYRGWLEWCYSYNGHYPYPLLSMLDYQQQTVLCAGSVAIMSLTTILLKWLYAGINGSGSATRLRKTFSSNGRPDKHL